MSPAARGTARGSASGWVVPVCHTPRPTQRTDGRFVAAEGGTLFLDEVGELPAWVQPKLLRALANREVRAVGRAEARTVDARIVAAMHRPLAEPAFRADLYARLAAWTNHNRYLAEKDVGPERVAGRFASEGEAESAMRGMWR
jgi:DNA-binding NtrC family response regulator